MRHVYIDESGDLGKQSKYVVLVALSTNQHRKLDKAMRQIWRAKPALHSHGELHAHAVDDNTRHRVLRILRTLSIDIHYTVIDKKQGLSLEEAYYTQLAKLISIYNAEDVVTVDQKDTLKKRQQVIRTLQLQNTYKKVRFVRSLEVKGLQAVDFIAWSIGRKYELDDVTYFDLIEDLTLL